MHLSLLIGPSTHCTGLYTPLTTLFLPLKIQLEISSRKLEFLLAQHIRGAARLAGKADIADRGALGAFPAAVPRSSLQAGLLQRPASAPREGGEAGAAKGAAPPCLTCAEPLGVLPVGVFLSLRPSLFVL